MSEPTIYNPSIYKGNGVYKNGASGGGASIPDYLQTVEYIDTSNYSEAMKNFALGGYISHTRSQNEYMVVKFIPKSLQEGVIFWNYDAFGATNGNGPSELSMNSVGNFRGSMGQSNKQVSISTLDWNNVLTGSFNYNTYVAKVTDINGVSVTAQDNAKTRYAVAQSRIAIFGQLSSSPTNTFIGKIYDAKLYSDNELKIDIRMCRHKQTNKPYAIDIISGVILANVSKDFNTDDYIEFGPDITLE